MAEIGEFEEIDPEAAYRTAIALAHDENVSEWGTMISALGEALLTPQVISFRRVGTAHGLSYNRTNQI